MSLLRCLFTFALALAASEPAGAAETVPTDAQLPGTQPEEVSQIQSVTKCDNCHGNFDPAGEPWFNWTGGLMSHASRDPIFWATLAIAEQDFDGSGDLCLRCHIPKGWLAGRSTPTDGSAMAEGDANGVQCDFCHRLTNPNAQEHAGEQNSPFIANDGSSSPDGPTGFYGSGMAVLSDDQNTKLGPYDNASATHGYAKSEFHRSSDLCGTCHDVSNPVVGDLAHNNGAQTPLAPGTFSGVPGAPVEQKAAFNNFPFQYGVVERTYSEHIASGFDDTLVSDYDTEIPADLRAGSIQRAYQAALLAGNGGDYADNTPRYFTCQTCHMRPTIGQGCNKNPPVRGDLAQHDQTGGNYWVPDVIKYQDDLSVLRLGSGLTTDQRDALSAGALRAQQNLNDAASLVVTGNVLRVTNLTGHKLITGYPEGRRMWLNVVWFDSDDIPIAQHEDGAYGPLTVQIDGLPTVVESILDLHGPYTRIYETHGAMTKEWADQLLALGVAPSLALGYDRITGDPNFTLGELAALTPGSYHETFHFVLNNYTAKDTRIPPWRMLETEAQARNILPVPAGRYPVQPDGTFPHFDDVVLNPPPGADHATISLLYQPTSWEYIQFLYLGNTGAVPFLADEGEKLLDAWLNGPVDSRMATPYTMVTTPWTDLIPACADGLDNDGDGLIDDADAGCNLGPESENTPEYACDDRLDNDGDGLRDYPADPGCESPTGTSELADDSDGDGITDGQDNCPYEPNGTQDDVDDNDRGDACECGDLSDDGRVTAFDATQVRLELAGLPSAFAAPRKCNVRGATDPNDADGNGLPDDCDLVDVVVTLRADAALNLPGIQQVCAAALP